MRFLTSISICFLFPVIAAAQPPGGGRGGDRGGERGGDRGGERGGGGDRGGPSGGSGFGGGFGGSPGGGSGFMFGGGGGMSDMIKRFDRNANNMIDPDETQGPAGFFLQRMAQNNPKIDLSKPIPIDTIVSEMDKMRGGRGSSESSGSNNSGGSSPTASSKPEIKLLVPDFKQAETLTPVPGFGTSSGSSPKVDIIDRDRTEAEERIRRYDKNGDNILDKDEIAQGRWSDGDVMQYDRNKDGKLSIEEMAVRQAKRRIAEQGQSNVKNSSNGSTSNGSSGWGSGGQSGWSRGGEKSAGTAEASKKKEEPKRFGDAKSYKMSNGSAAVSGLPSFFTTSDINADNQVTLPEFAGTLTETALTEFQQWDLNADGIITARECQAAVKAGVKVGVGGTASSPTSPTATSSVVKAGPSEADMEWARKLVSKYDKDGDGSLSKSEVDKMLIKPKSGADVNNDGKISVEEYAAFRSK